MQFRLALAAALLLAIGACAQISGALNRDRETQQAQDVLPDGGPPVVNGFYDFEGSCPFEGCGLGDLYALVPVELLERPALDARVVATVPAGEIRIVDAQWRERNLDQIIDNRVDIAVTEITNETSWTDRLKTLADNEKAQQLATAVAERVYRSDAVKTAIADLASGVAKEVGKSIEFASTDATNTLLQCLKAFVGPRYGGAVANVLAGDASRSVNVDPNKASGKVSAGSVLNESTGGLAGATILIVRRQLANLAQRVGQRIVGSVLSRVVSVVGA